MPASGTERTVTEIRRPLASAAAYLSPYMSRIRRAWRSMLRHYEPCGQYAPLLANLYLSKRFRDVSSTPSHAYRLESEYQGKDLASKGVPVECAAAAISLYVKSCLPHLRHADKAEDYQRALVRWASVYQFFLIAGYRKQITTDRQALQEKVRATERRFQALSAELGDAYEIERRRLAQDLHDEIGHDLIVLKLYTQIIGMDLKKDNIKEVRRKLKESISLIDHALQSVRHLVFDLGPAVWNEQGFVAAVKAYSRQFADRTGIKVHFNARRLPATLPSSYETALYKVLQGSLANIGAHANAKNVNVTLISRRDSIVMRVEDDGKGFDVDRTMGTVPESYGLRAMRDRIELLGGEVQVTSRPSNGALRGGTTVEVTLPVQKVAGAA